MNRTNRTPPRSARVLLTLGRLPKGLEVARAMRRTGCTVFVADPYGSHLCKPSRAVKRSFRVTAPNIDALAYRRQLLEIVIGEGIDLVIPVSEEAPHVAPLAADLPAHARMFGADFQTLTTLGNKLRFAEMAGGLGLAVPETHRADTAAAAELAATKDHVIKPLHGSSGLGLKLRRAGDALGPDDRTPEQLVQQRVEGRHVSSFAMARAGEALVTVVYEGGVMSGTTAVCFVRADDVPQVHEWVQAFVAATAHDGFISFDFILDDDGTPFAIECNPRLTSGVHFVQPETIAAFVLGAPLPDGPPLKWQRKFQEGHTALLESYGALFTGRFGEFFRRFGHVLSSKDVLFGWRDPLPFLLMTPMSWPVLSRVMLKGMSFGEASTHDIQWRPDEASGQSEEVSADAAHAL